MLSGGGREMEDDDGREEVEEELQVEVEEGRGEVLRLSSVEVWQIGNERV